MSGNIFCTIALLVWLPLAVGIFLSFSPLRALCITALAGFMFMPMADYSFAFIPYNKTTAIPLGLTLGLFFSDIGTLFSFRPKWFDIPMLMFCSGIFWSGLVNRFSNYDSAAAGATNLVMYGLPYFLGRIYLRDAASLYRFALAIFYGGLIYVPFCIVEMKFGPEWHHWVYGYYAHPDYLQSVRGGGYRPVVFLQHGLMLGLYMTAASLCGIWLWKNKLLPKTVFYMPSGFWLVVLVGVTLFCRSTGALLLMGLGLAVLFGTRRLHSVVLMLLLVAMPVAYILARTATPWNGENVAELAQKYLSQERADSLRNRLENERMIVAKALQKPYFGWGPKGAEKIMDPDVPTKILATPDGMWNAALGQMGWFGLIGSYGVFLLPPLMLLWRFGAKSWSHPMLAAPEVLAVIGLLFALDNLMNNMVNPLYYLALGGIATFAVAPTQGPWPMARSTARRYHPTQPLPSRVSG
jgi:hypothetical protein